MTHFLQNLRWGARQLVHHPSYSVTAVVCLSLGIGVNLAIFSLLYSVLLDPVPGVSEPERLVIVNSKPITIPGLEGQTFTRPLSYPNFQDYRKRSEVFSAFAAIYPAPLHLSGDRVAERIQAQFVSGDFFATLGLTPAAGRLIHESDLAKGSEAAVAVISHDLWQRRFGGGSEVVGERITLNRNRAQILGVAPVGFQGVFLGDDTDIWLPLSQSESLIPDFPSSGLSDADHEWLLWFVGRLRDGIEMEKAQARLDILAAQLNEVYGEARRNVALQLASGIGIQPGMRQDTLEPLWLLTAAVALVLLIACANVAGLMLVRSVGRREELKVRLTLGASRRHLFHQFLSESAILATVSSAIGLGLALLLLRTLAGVRLGQYLPPLPETGLELRLVVFAVVSIFVTTLITGTLPALRAAHSLRPSLHGVLGDTLRGQQVRQGLLVLQVALAFLLLVGTGLFLRTLWNLQAIDPGFHGDKVLSLKLDLQAEGYGDTEGRAFVERLLAELNRVPDFSAATVASQAPLGQGGTQSSVAKVQTLRADSEERWLQFNRIGPDYFRTLGIPLVGGRGFSSEDRPGTTPVVIVNQALSKLLWPGEERVVGKRVEIGDSTFQVLGVAPNIRYSTLHEKAEPHFFLPLYQSFSTEIFLHVLTQGDPWRQVSTLRNLIHRLDERIVVFEVQLLSQRVDRALAQPRLYVRLLGAFGLLALTLTVIGIYGAIAYSGEERRSEIGVRIALGANHSRILFKEIGKALSVSGLGLALGLLAAIALGRFVEARLYGVAPLDGPTLATAACVVLAMTIAASYFPAYRISRTDPVRAIQG